MSYNFAAILYFIAGVLFILSLRGLSSPQSAIQGNRLAIAGMTLAVVTTLMVSPPTDLTSFFLIVVAIAIGAGIGIFTAKKIPMTAMPELVAFFHSLVGLAAVLVAIVAFSIPEQFNIATDGDIKIASRFEMAIGLIIGAMTFTGSIVAFAKLRGILSSAPLVFDRQHQINAGIAALILLLVIIFGVSQSDFVFYTILILALVIGVLIIVPIGGADMPVVVSMLNSYSGWAAAGIGFTINNTALIITGALVGSSGAILSHIMCKGMNRSFINVILGGFGSSDEQNKNVPKKYAENVKQGNAEDACFILSNASKIIIVPGYGMAVAQAQHALRDMATHIKNKDIKVLYAVHPVAGRMPGHMNVLLAEADIPYDEIFEMDEINSEFATADVAFVIGANDVTNPAAKNDKNSPIYGMPILEVGNAKNVLFIKRGLGTGYAGIQNELFFRDNTMMLFGDAKKVTENIVKAF